MAVRIDPRLIGALGIVALICAAALLAGAGVPLLHLAPALFLFAALAARRYPGEQRLLRLASRRRPARPRVARLHTPASPPRRRLSGGLLLAEALAERGPPALALAS